MIPNQSLKEDVQGLNEIMGGIGNNLKFCIVEENNRFMVRLEKKKAGELIGEFAPDRIRALRTRIQDVVTTILEE